MKPLCVELAALADEELATLADVELAKAEISKQT